MSEDSTKKFADQVHLLIHSARLIPGYKASILEQKLSSMVIKQYSSSCDECKEAGEKIKNQPQQESFMKKIGGMLDGN